MPKNIILNSIKESFALIWKNKFLFVLLFALQLVFFVTFFYINLTYQTKILESAKAITDYLSQQKLDEASVTSNIFQQKSILGDDPLSISRNFNEILKNFRLYLIYVFILLIFFISVSWAVTHRLMHKINLKQLLKNLFKIFVILLFYLGLIFSFLFYLFNISFTQVASEGARLLAKFTPFLLFSIILVYFMFVSLSLLHNTELKYIVQKTLSIGIKKIHYVLAAYFISLFLFVISIFLLYSFIEENLFVLSLSIILIVLSFVFGRIFTIKVIEKLDS